jgi:hypothetical protein
MASKSWEKSKVTEGVLSPFVMMGSITVKNYRIHKATEKVPAPQAGEYVTFISHLERGFVTPSLFFRRFCVFYRIKPSDLGPHSIQQIAGFVALCERYLGCEPYFPLWLTLFQGRHSGKG